VKDRGQKTKDRSQRGSALIITVLIVTILVALVVEFAYEVYIDTSSLSNWTNAQKASLIAKSGQTLSTKYITEINKSYNTQSEVELPVEKDFGLNTHLTIRIEDENARFNINSILQKDLFTNKTTNLTNLQNLFEYLNINPKLALLIADWIDSDNEHREGLSDSENNARNALLQSIDELKLIPGIDKNTFDKISPFITVYGNNLINVNTAKLPVLMSLHKDMTETLAKRIIDYRDASPFEDKKHVQRVSGMESIGQVIKIDVKSSDFRITTNATVNEITRIIESVVDNTSMRIQFWREK
jgi:general secretion pathway protein K